MELEDLFNEKFNIIPIIRGKTTTQITNRQGWQFVGNIHAKTHEHVKNDYAKTQGLAIANQS